MSRALCPYTNEQIVCIRDCVNGNYDCFECSFFRNNENQEGRKK